MMKDGQEFRVIDENCWSPEARLADMDKTGDNAKLSVLVSFVYSAFTNFRCNSSDTLHCPSYV